MSASSIQTEKLLQEYTVLAPAYDRRWSAYLSASFDMTLEKLLDLPAERVLDVACGTGGLLELLAERHNFPELVGIDRVPAMLGVAKRRLGRRALLNEGEARRLPFGDGTFQLIVSTNALHYFPDVGVALREIRRVISPGGNLVITDWCRDYFWMKILNRLLPWTSHAHAQTLSSTELRQSLLKAGFSIQSESQRKIDGFWALMTVHATPLS